MTDAAVSTATGGATLATEHAEAQGLWSDAWAVLRRRPLFWISSAVISSSIRNFSASSSSKSASCSISFWWASSALSLRSAGISSTS